MAIIRLTITIPPINTTVLPITVVTAARRFHLDLRSAALTGMAAFTGTVVGTIINQ